MEKIFNKEVLLIKTYGRASAKKIKIRMNEFRAAASLQDFWPPKCRPSRCHELVGGKRAGRFSVDLNQPYRLLFTPEHDPKPTHEDGSLDWFRVTTIKILDVEDTHD